MGNRNLEKQSNIRVPYSMSVHGEEEIDACLQVLRTTTQMGKNVAEFEAAIAERFCKKIGIFVNSGSSALFLSVEAMNLPAGSHVLTPALTFATTVGSIIKHDLIPVFVDVEIDTFNIDADKVESMITNDCRAMSIPNLMGNLPDWEKLREIAVKHDLQIIEDSADILGAKYKGENMGRYSDISTCSFYGNHVINCAGNGGIICTNDKKLAEKIRLLRSWGRSSTIITDSESIDSRFDVDVDAVPYDAKFVFEEIGYNLEGSELGAAFGLIQNKRLSSFLSRRKEITSAHTEYFGQHKGWLDLPRLNKDADTVWFAYPLIVREDAPFSRQDVQIFLEKRNIQTRPIFTGNIIRQPGFRHIRKVVDPEGYPNSDRVMERGFLIGAHHGMTSDMVEYVHDTFTEFANQF